MKTNEETRQKILDAANQIFHEYGPIKATLADVAHKAGISKSLIYYYFQDKNALFREVALKMARRFIAGMRKRVMQEKTAVDRLRVLMTERFERLTRVAARRKVSLERSLEYYPVFHSLMDMFWDEETGLIHELIVFGNDRGEFHVAEPYAWSRQVAMVLLALDHQVFMQDNEEVINPDAWQAVVDTITRGLKCGN